MKLICLPHSGASSTVFYNWKKYSPPDCQLVGLDYPGHGTRSGEELIWTYAESVEDIYKTYSSQFTEPFFLFGHSVGALVALGLARRFEADQNKNFQRLLICGHEAPHMPDDEPNIGHLSDAEFVEILQERYGELPEAIFRDDELYKQFVPMIKADVNVSENYVHQEFPPLSTPLKIFVPEHDKFFSYEEAQHWEGYSRSFLGTKLIPGDHISCMSEPAAIKIITKVSL